MWGGNSQIKFYKDIIYTYKNNLTHNKIFPLSIDNQYLYVNLPDELTDINQHRYIFVNGTLPIRGEVNNQTMIFKKNLIKFKHIDKDVTNPVILSNILHKNIQFNLKNNSSIVFEDGTTLDTSLKYNVIDQKYFQEKLLLILLKILKLLTLHQMMNGSIIT